MKAQEDAPCSFSMIRYSASRRHSISSFFGKPLYQIVNSCNESKLFVVKQLIGDEICATRHTIFAHLCSALSVQRENLGLDMMISYYLKML